LGGSVAKDKTKKKRAKAGGGKSTSSLKALTQNPVVADVVAAALVATAAALKDSRRAKALASDVGDELAKLTKTGTRQGEALWDMALQIGRRSLEAVTGGDEGSKRAKPKSSSKSPPKAKQKSGVKKGSKKKSAGASKR
jgi:hypothetical protein